MATAALVVTAVFAAASAYSTNKAGKVQRKQNAISNRIAATQRTREVRRSIAARRIQTANTQAQGFQLGVAGGTAVQGATFGLASDSASSIAASNQQFTGQQVLSGLSDKMSRLQSQASTFGAISSLAGMFTGGVGTEGAQNRAAIASLIG
jgi:hypothetical protein